MLILRNSVVNRDRCIGMNMISDNVQSCKTFIENRIYCELINVYKNIYTYTISRYAHKTSKCQRIV